MSAKLFNFISFGTEINIIIHILFSKKYYVNDTLSKQEKYLSRLRCSEDEINDANRSGIALLNVRKCRLYTEI